MPGLRSNEPLTEAELREQFEEFAGIKGLSVEHIELCWMYYRAGWKMREYNDAHVNAPPGFGGLAMDVAAPE
jgi:hypothetical protein